jgi:hypothetical protein
MDLSDAVSKIISFKASVDATVFAQEQERLRSSLQRARQFLGATQQRRDDWSSFEILWREKSTQVQHDMFNQVVSWCALTRGPHSLLGIDGSEWQHSQALFASLVGSSLLEPAAFADQQQQQQLLLVLSRAQLHASDDYAEVLRKSDAADRRAVLSQLKLLEQSSSSDGSGGTSFRGQLLSKDTRLVDTLVLLK